MRFKRISTSGGLLRLGLHRSLLLCRGESRTALQALVDLLLKGRQLLSDDYKNNNGFAVSLGRPLGESLSRKWTSGEKLPRFGSRCGVLLSRRMPNLLPANAGFAGRTGEKEIV
jgi:hypothetical protein